MAGKKYVTVKCEAKDKSLKCVKFDGVVKAAINAVSNAINSSGKLTTKDKSPEGVILTVNITTLKGDNNDKPTKLEAKAAITAVSFGGTAKAFNGSASGSMTGVGKPQESAEELVSDVLEGFMPKAIAAMAGF